MSNQLLAKNLREGIRLLEAAYKQEIRTACKNGASVKRDHERAADMFYRGNKLISSALAKLDGPKALDALPGKIGGNIHV